MSTKLTEIDTNFEPVSSNNRRPGINDTETSSPGSIRGRGFYPRSRPYNMRSRGRGRSLFRKPFPSSFVPKSDRPAVEHTKQEAKPTGLQMYQVPTWYPVFVSNIGIRFLCDVFFSSIEGRDQRMSTSVTQLQFEYVTCLCFINRVIQVNLLNGNAGPYTEASDLRSVTRSIYLPAPILRYIESIGVVALSSGVTIGPLFTNQLYIANPLCVSPQDILADAGRPIPPGHWGIDYNWITAWNQHTTRASRRSMGFGYIDNAVATGKPDLCVSRNHIDAQIVQAFAPCQLSEEEAKLGVCYEWRDETSREYWPGDFNGVLYPALRGSEFNAASYFESIATSYIVHDD